MMDGARQYIVESFHCDLFLTLDEVPASEKPRQSGCDNPARILTRGNGL